MTDAAAAVASTAAPAPAAAPAANDAAPAPVLGAKLDDFPVGDDFLLREAVEAGAALGAIARGILPFSRPYTREEITARWRALLYDPNVARPAAKRMARYIVDASPKVAPLPVGPDFARAFAARKKKAAAAAAAAEAEAESVPADGGGGDAMAMNGEDGGGNGDDDVDEHLGYIGLDAPPSFAEAEACVLDLPALPAFAQVDADERKRAKTALARALHKIRKLEASAQAATARAATAKGALGVLQGANATFLLTKRETIIGRSTDDQKVDVDLAEEGNASKVSRQQAFIRLRYNGEFVLRNVGRRPVWVNATGVESGHRCALAPHSLIEVGGMRLLFLPNPTLVRKQEPEPVAFL